MRMTTTVDEHYSLAAIVRAQLAQTWAKVGSFERDVHQRLVDTHGPCARANSVRLPHNALRDLTAASSGAPLVATKDLGLLPTLQPRSVVLSLGATQIDAGKGNIVLAKGTTAPTTQWLTDENAAITETQPVFGQVASSPKILACLIECSIRCCFSRTRKRTFAASSHAPPRPRSIKRLFRAQA